MSGFESGTGDPFVHFDAPYVLGALSPVEREAYETHLATCRDCSAAVAELRAMPSLLSRVPTEAVEALSEPVAPTRLPQRRRLLVGAGLLAAAAAVIGVVAVVAVSGDDESPPLASGTSIEFAAVEGSAATASAELVSVDWGTKINLECSVPYGDELGVYTLVVVDRQGQDQQVATWNAVADRTLTVPASTAVEASDIGSVEVRSVDGTAVLVARL